ncbi:MAG: FAD-dependent oxidoreductase, partial [Flavobacterium sp.]
MTEQTKNFDIAIIGGGMVGASLALLLSAQKPDWKIALLE